jgi:hypothetical protein
MITSKQILNISDEYFGAKNVAGSYTIIYDNPTTSDLKELNQNINPSNFQKTVRFIADYNTKKVYIWDAFNAHHMQMRPVLGYNSDSLYDNALIDGYANLSGNKLPIDYWGDFDAWMVVNKANPKWIADIVPFLKRLFTLNWSWLDKYVSGTSLFLNDCKQKFESRLKS